MDSEISVTLFTNGRKNMAVERRQYSAEFKQEAVRLITQGGRSPAQVAPQVAHELGINGKMLGKWKRQLTLALTLAQQAQAQGRTSYEAFPDQGRAHDEELARLRACGGRIQRSRWNGMC
jgi:transposase-like protein